MLYATNASYMYLYHGWFSLTNHVAVLEVSISDIHLVGGVYLDRHLPLRLFAYMVQLCVQLFDTELQVETAYYCSTSLTAMCFFRKRRATVFYTSLYCVRVIPQVWAWPTVMGVVSSCFVDRMTALCL